MKWIGHHIWSFISRFRNDVYLEDLSSSTDTRVLVANATTGKVTYNTGAGDDMTFNVTGDSGTPEAIVDGNTLDIAGGSDIETTVSSTDTLTIDHSSVSRSDTTSAASPAHGATFTCYDGITSGSNGHLTAANLKTVTLPADLSGRTTFTAAGDSGSSQTISDGETLTITGGTNCTTVASATDTITINSTDTNTNQQTTWTAEDGDGSNALTISHGKKIKFCDSVLNDRRNIDINWTDTTPGSDADPFDLTWNAGNDTQSFSFTTTEGFVELVGAGYAAGAGTGIIMNHNNAQHNALLQGIDLTAVPLLQGIRGGVRVFADDSTPKYLQPGRVIMTCTEEISGRLSIYKLPVCLMDPEQAEGTFNMNSINYEMMRFTFTGLGVNTPLCINPTIASEAIRTLDEDHIIIPVLNNFAGEAHESVVIDGICTLQYSI